MDPIASIISRLSRSEAEDSIFSMSASGSFSYRQVDELSRQVRDFLLHRGLPPGDAVALEVIRDEVYPALVLGIIRAGGVYVPIDTTGEDARIPSKVALLRPFAYVTSRLKSKNDVSISQRHVFIEDMLLETGYQEDYSDRFHENCYVLFTSGSTGVPKGVVGTRSSIGYRIDNIAFWCGASNRDTFILSSSSHYNDSIWQMLEAMFFGARIVVVESVCQKNPWLFSQTLDDFKVTRLYASPSLIKALSAAGIQADKLRSVKTLICSGEHLEDSTARKAIDLFSNATIFNVYGATEATSMLWEDVRFAISTGVRKAKSGRNQQLVVVDDNMLRVKSGEVGFLTVSGPNVSPGYTDTEIASSPFLFFDDRHWYFTGDLAKEEDDGSYQIFGRKDNIVNLRGHRISLTEIENCISRIDYVQDCAVICDAVSNGADTSKLIAFVKLNCEKHMGERYADAVRHDLSASLPEHMRPSVVIAVDEIPRGETGKINRHKLQCHLISRPWHSVSKSVHTLEDHRRICSEMFCKYLGVRDISPNCSFFEAGGDSLSFVSMLIELAECLSIDISDGGLFEYDTPMMLANRSFSVSKEAIGDASQEDVPVVSHRQLCFVRSSMTSPACTCANLCTVFKIDNAPSDEVLKKSVDELVASYPILRHRYDIAPSMDVTLGSNACEVTTHFFGHPDVPINSRRVVLDDFVKERLSQSLNQRGKAYFAVYFLRWSPIEVSTVFIAHHLIADGFSLDIIKQRFLNIILGKRDHFNEHRHGLPYDDFCVAELKNRSSNSFVLARSYWTKELEGLPTQFTISKTVSSNPVGEACSVVKDLPSNLATSVETVRRLLGTSVAAVYLAAVARYLQRVSGSSNVPVAVPLLGRSSRRELSSVGSFATLSLIQVPSCLEPEMLIQTVHRKLRGAQAHSLFQFHDMMDHLNISSTSSTSFPITSIMFNSGSANGVEADSLSDRLDLHRLTGRDIRFEVQFQLIRAGSESLFEVVYRSDLFDKSEIEMIYSSFLQELAGLVVQKEHDA